MQRNIIIIPYDIDPSLHDSKPEREHLGDGFSPPEPDASPAAPAEIHAEEVLSEKSLF